MSPIGVFRGKIEKSENVIEKEINLNCISRFGLYRAVNTLYLSYKRQTVNTVHGTQSPFVLRSVQNTESRPVAKTESVNVGIHGACSYH